MKKLAVFGNPIHQSKSPLIHQLFAQQFDMSIDYQPILGDLDNFEQQVRQFFTQTNAIGVNVTSPFKSRAKSLADSSSENVESCNAANTLMLKNNKLHAYNTDGQGLVADLQRLDMPVKDAKIALIGAGGAARGVIMPLLSAGVKKLYVINRTLSSAQQLIKDLGAPENLMLYQEEKFDGQVDLVINATSSSLQQQLPNIELCRFKACEAVYDMVYLQKPTVFMDYFKQQGCRLRADGLGMLVGQAAHSFNIWFGEFPSFTPVLQALKAAKV